MVLAYLYSDDLFVYTIKAILTYKVLRENIVKTVRAFSRSIYNRNYFKIYSVSNTWLLLDAVNHGRFLHCLCEHMTELREMEYLLG